MKKKREENRRKIEDNKIHLPGTVSFGFLYNFPYFKQAAAHKKPFLSFIPFSVSLWSGSFFFFFFFSLIHLVTTLSRFAEKNSFEYSLCLCYTANWIYRDVKMKLNEKSDGKKLRCWLWFLFRIQSEHLNFFLINACIRRSEVKCVPVDTFVTIQKPNGILWIELFVLNFILRIWPKANFACASSSRWILGHLW